MSKTEHLPPTTRLPAAGIAALYAAGRPWVASRMVASNGPAATVNIPGFGRSVGVADPALVKQVFTARADLLHSGDESPLKRTLGRNSLFALDEEAHLRQRRLILPPFHGERMGEYTRIFEEESVREFETWPIERDFATLDSMMMLTLNAILRAVFGAEGEEFDGLRRLIPPFVKHASFLTAVPPLQRNRRGWNPWAKFLKMRAEYDVLIDQLIAKHRADPDLDQRSDVLALLLQARYEDGTPMSRDQLADQLLTILVAGHETTAGTLAWAVERLRRHPALLARLVEESRAGGSKLREATIWEIQRTRPVVVATDRIAVKPFELGQWTVPAGMHVVVDFLSMHRNPELFPDPLKFNPDRFLDSAPGTYEWIPFGGGLRRCVGAAFAKLEMDVVLRMLLTRCEWVPTSAPDEPWRFRGVAFVPRPGGVARFRSIDLSPLDAAEESATATEVTA